MQVGLPGVALHFKVSGNATVPAKHGRGCTYAVSLLTQLAALLTKQICNVSTACKGRAHAIGGRPTCSKRCCLAERISQVSTGFCSQHSPFRPLLQIQHQNEINDAFFLADALTKRCARVLRQPAGPCGLHCGPCCLSASCSPVHTMSPMCCLAYSTCTASYAALHCGGDGEPGPCFQALICCLALAVGPACPLQRGLPYACAACSVLRPTVLSAA